ncbi:MULTISPECIES: hypothetical protein [unclassified Acinetobacter]|uniref:hypothetical protein n=1 Tax=unclassified Acinetobacter TaxID=196816 RepID=UPI00190A5355|nr:MULTISPECIES: hypothetical protein [unclassified Acinetobacter]MBK0063277.1 hypothetical protein [Acinetobacter sp. S55]MBK0066811.1 hypothetical protein [Acinetobacter sp. S54]
MIHNLSFTQSEHSRAEAMAFIKNAISTDLWTFNTELVRRLKVDIDDHALFEHPILSDLKSQKINFEQLKIIHINYLNCIVKIFTDALSMLIFQAQQLESNTNIHLHNRILSKIYARYLLSLNLLDELGFDTADLQQSSPAKSHLAYYLKILETFGVDPLSQNSIEPEALELQNFIRGHYDSYIALLLILSITEKQVIVFSEALHLNLKKFGDIFDQGYYACHGLANDEDNLANDDNHANDLWMLCIQAISPESETILRETTQNYLSLWQDFWTKMYQITLNSI